MRLRLRISAAALALLFLSSCTRVFLVTAVFVGGRLTFVSDDDEVTHAPWCWKSFTLIDDSGEPVWEFDASGAYRDADRCGPNFPLAYGRAPDRAEVLVGPRRLEPGRLYFIAGSAAGLLEGAFVLQPRGDRVSIRNVDPRSPQARQARDRHGDWQAVHAPLRVTVGEPAIQDHRAQGPEPFMVPENRAAGPAGNDRYTWLLNVGERAGLPSLSYASLDGQGIMVGMSCRWRGFVILSRAASAPRAGGRLQLFSGPHRLSARFSRFGPPPGQFRAAAALAENDPVLRNFGLTGRLSLRQADRVVALDAIDERERRTVRRFFEHCHFGGEGEPGLPWH